MNEDISKSQARRDALELKAFGEKLLALSPRQLEQLSLPSDLLDAVVAFRKIKSRLAQKRHVQYVANILRHIEDVELLVAAYDRLMSSADLNSPRFRLIEQWRTRLLEEDNAALTEFLSTYPCDQVQQLRQLVRKAKSDLVAGKETSSSTALFRFIRELIP